MSNGRMQKVKSFLKRTFARVLAVVKLEKVNGEGELATTVKRINIMLQSLNESDLRMVEGIIRTIKENRETKEV